MAERTQRQKDTGQLVRVGIILAVILATGVIGLIAAGNNQRQAELDSPELQSGKQVYDAHCAGCHGINGEGQTEYIEGQAPAPAHDDTGHTWHHPDEQLFEIVKYGGSPGMPAFEETLTDEEIRASLAYIKTFWTSTQRTQQASLNGE